MHLKLIELQLWGSEKSIEELKLFAAAQDKLRLCGINSIILWEDQWKGKSDIVKSRLMALLGISIRIPARLTYSVRINKEIAGQFLGKNHLQGTVQSKYQFGLYLPVKYFRILPTGFQVTNVNEDLLVAVATFSHVRIFIKQEKPFRSFELIRFSNLINTTVVGGMDKLLSAFTKEIHPDDIMTYIDKEWSDGISYAKLGFERISEKPPITFWLDTEKYVRFSDRKHTTGKNTIQICNVGSLKFVKTIIKKPSGF
ncbi:hypothetical protein [Dyadobacter sp. NIV53]|uniref:hypothetical protein n=1 Tax=Dyadobacter sp. NIV53 TaxID=2861765 RepID=UPI001E35694F|nr:hypothetical protein [Dyadobacter sp. NIV53]